ncbi:MAG TPA: M12 family metallo-peptidase [Steroidobacteraceae bacterium]|nr:M12 family metallo-peptidase [Steroidobacteraceae bacterium]
MARRGFIALCGIALLVVAMSADAHEFRILYAESLQMAQPLPRAGIRAAPAAPLTAMSFLAYGRQFELTLEANDRLFAGLPAEQRAALRSLQVYRGEVAGARGSWVRLTRVGDTLEGMLWDGNDLYTIEPAQRARPFMVDAARVSNDATVIYRLSDTISDLGPQFCDVMTPPEGATPLAAYKAMVEELRGNQALAAAAALTGQIQIAVLGDLAFSTDHPADGQSTIVTRMNVVDGIFSGQVGVHIVVASIQVFNAGNDPFSSTTVPSTLLNEFGDYKNTTAAIRNRAIAHLMTGRDFDGSTVGIAFLASLCNPRFGVSISEGGAEVGPTSAALIAAHEMGHVFGAPHDAESDPMQNQACASTAPTFLMAASLNGSSTFSQCSLDQMQPVISGAACIEAAVVADAAVSATPSSVSNLANQPLNYSIHVDSVGTSAVNAATLSISVPASITVQSATPDAGSCSSGAGAVTCDLGTLPAGSSRRVDLSMLGSLAGAFTSTASLSAGNDGAAQNNSASVTLLVTQASTPPPPSRGGGGGGGGTGALEALALVFALSRRARVAARRA